MTRPSAAGAWSLAVLLGGMMVVTGPALVSCGGILLPDSIPGDAGSGASSGATDAGAGPSDATSGASSDATSGAASDATPGVPGGDDGSDLSDASSGSDGASPYNDLSYSGNWSVYNLRAVDENANGLSGGTFDGRYVYFVGADALRYDTTGDFTSPGAWSSFAPEGPNASFQGGAFDGHFVYLAGPVVARFDPQSPFASPASWSTFDTRTLAAGTYVAGAVFDGRYLYFVGDVVARYDTRAAFASPSSWSTFDASTLTKSPTFRGGVFDGRYVYLVPGASAAPVVRYDTTAAFGAGSSWASADPMSFFPGAAGTFSGAFDGRFVYLLPSAGTTVVRYDTTGSFVDPAAWSAFASTQVSPGYAVPSRGAAFDGRYVYSIPQGFPPYVDRYDTTAAFTSATSWSGFAPWYYPNQTYGFAGAVFDGRFIYLIPTASSPTGGPGNTLARFDARNPRAMPQLPGWSGSFF